MHKIIMKKGAQYVKGFDKRKQEDKSLCCEIFDVMVQFMIHTFFYTTPTCIDTKHILQLPLPGISFCDSMH